MAATVPILSLTSNQQVERPIIAIDKVPYELRSPGDLSIRQSLALDLAMQRMTALSIALMDVEGKHGVDDIDDEAINNALLAVLLLVLDAPREVIENLKPTAKLQAVRVFIELSAQMPNGTKAIAKMGRPRPGFRQPKKRTGMKTSRGSRGSTAAIRGRGSRPTP